MTFSRFGVFYFAVVAIGLLALTVRFLGDGSGEVSEVALPDRAEALASAFGEPPPPTHGSGVVEREDWTLRSGEAVEISAEALPAGRAVALNLPLGEPSADGDPLPGRILSEGRAPLDLSAAILGEDRRTARVEIEEGWLSPGRYVVEVRTTERTHLPLRRYALEVR